MKPDRAAAMLPGIYQRTLDSGTPLAALLEVMAALHAPSEEVLDQLDRFFDPRRAPPEFVPYLARWLDLGPLLDVGARGVDAEPLPSGTGRLRELVAEAVELSRWRGTRRGTVRLLEIMSGQIGFGIDEEVPGEDGRPRPFHVRVRAPAAAAAFEGMLRRAIEMAKPAYVSYQLEFEAVSETDNDTETETAARTATHTKAGARRQRRREEAEDG